LHLNVCSSPAMRFSKFTAACKQSWVWNLFFIDARLYV
jgi:hypothetical protein